jgi:short-subunit dehydrogenase
VILLTGATAGLGLAIAKLLVAKTDDYLILTARRESLPRFAEAGIKASEQVWIRPLDVVDPEQREAIVDEANSQLGGIDVLINNAGVAYRAVLEHVREPDRLAQMDINFQSPVDLIRLVLPGMRERRRGRIISISSVGGMMAMPTMAIYAASKFALEGAHEALWYEVRPWGIYVTLVQPGFIRSQSFRLVRHTDQSQQGEDDTSDPYHSHYAHMSGFVERLMSRAFYTSDDVAQVVLRTIRRKRPPLRVSGTPDAFFFATLRRFLPRSWYHAFLYRMLPGVHKWGHVLMEEYPESQS